MVLAVDLVGEWDDSGCFGHTLQLAVNAGLNLNPLSHLLAAARKLVGHFKHSVAALASLNNRRQCMCLTIDSSNMCPQGETLHILMETCWTEMDDICCSSRWTCEPPRICNSWSETWPMGTVITDGDCIVSWPKRLSFPNLPSVNGLLKKHLVIGSDDLPVVKRFKELVAGELHHRFQFDWHT